MNKTENEIIFQKKWISNDFKFYSVSQKIPNLFIFRIFLALALPEYGVLYFYRKSRINRLKKKYWKSYLYHLINYRLNHVDISSDSVLGFGIRFPHPLAIVIGGNSIIGKETILFSCITIGTNSVKKEYEYPVIGENCYIGTGAKIFGGITIGNNSMIGANAVVINSFPENSKIVGVPAKNIGYEKN